MFAFNASSEACRCASPRMSPRLCLIEITRNVSANKTHPACSSHRQWFDVATPKMDCGQYIPRKKWSSTTTIVADASTFQSR